MSLFQHSVLNKYLKGLDTEKVNEAYERFKNHFHNPTIQENIRNSKEEQYQGEFLIDLFVNVFGYVKNPTPDFNLTTELKNIKDAKKTDGAILKEGKALAVIELKGTNTTDLSKVEIQAFGYKNNQLGCNYVITSNFEKLRFYIDNSIDFEEFNLFKINKERFNILWLCLSSEYLLNDIPKKIKDASLTQEENVTKKLYKDYAAFRNEIFENIQKENPTYDKLTLFKKTQKLLDRFLFIFFAEDRLLLPPNSIRSIVNQWTDLRDKYDAYFPLYDRFKKYFGYMDTGHKGQQHTIFAYNGGLFAPDDVLDKIKINDDLLFKHTVNLSNYDFESEISVNILGHIFEHSLTEIESIQNQIESNKGKDKGLKPLAEMDSLAINKKHPVGKRKKDGVFYTPKYITKYIVDNTIGKLCDEKKMTLDIQESEYKKERKGRQKATLKNLNQKLDAYRKWLLQISICDPACGSGAFLNQALEFLIAEHRFIDELEAKLFGDALVLSEVENKILENNLFGVDINQESVEIAKLSLWLRTAQKGRKLTSLNNNIKCGNSLIDDPNVAGDKAFNWHREFPTIFKEKDKKAYHITTAIHDSRTSARMVKYKVRERRDLGTNPYPNIIYFTPEYDLIITQTIADILKEDNLNLLAYNICADHIHLLLVCNIDEIPAIMQKIKGRTSHELNVYKGFNVNVYKGFKPLVEKEPLAEEKKKRTKPLWQQKYSAPKEVTSQEQLYNTIKYIQTNRKKHELPAHSSVLQKIIDTMTCTLDKALEPEYDGGFDVVIGNPPYVQSLVSNLEKAYYKTNYYSNEGKPDLYRFFIEKGITLLNSNSKFSFITPNSFLTIPSANKLRDFIKKESSLTQIVNFEGMVFKDANINTVIFVINSEKLNNDLSLVNDVSPNPSAISLSIAISNEVVLKFNDYKSSSIFNVKYSDINTEKLIEKIKKSPNTLSSISKYTLGLQVYHNTLHSKEGIKDRFYHNIEKLNSSYIPEIGGKNLSRYSISLEGLEYVSLGDWCYNKPDDFYLTGNRIFIREIPSPTHLIATLFKQEGVPNKAIIIVKSLVFNMYSLLGLINSRLIGFYIHKTTEKGKQKLFPRISLTSIKNIPILKNDDVNLSQKVEKHLEKVSFLEKQKKSFLDLLKGKYNIKKTSKKLQNWHTLDFATFLKELEKARKASVKNNKDFNKGFKPLVVLGLAEEAEWLQYFNVQKEKAQILKNQIDKTDREIDQMVYKLYDLTEDEIAIIEEATA